MSSSILVPGPHSIVHICPQQPVAESVTCRSTQMLQWRVTFGGSLTLSDVTMQYIPSDPVGRTDVATRNGFNFAFNLTVNNQSQLVSIMMVTGQINATTNITVHCGQDILHLSWIAVQGEYMFSVQIIILMVKQIFFFLNGA